MLIEPRVTRSALTAAAVPLCAMAIAVAIEPAVLPDSELRFLALRGLPFGPRQRGSYQRPMHRPFVFGSGRVGF
jgi:hypothetical protein